jgi:APA family basic amino acid/polyamine antiporter
VLGVGFGIAVALGSAVGAGILRAPADVAARLPTPALFLGVWMLGGAYALLGANALAELGAMIPRSGAQYVFVRRAYGDFAGFVVGWNDWLSTCATNAAVALVAAGAIGALAPALAPYAATVGAALVVALTLVAWGGARASDRAQRAASAVKAAAFLGLVLACFAYAAAHGWAASPPAAGAAAPRGLALGVALVAALQGVIFAYDGWVGVLYFSEEVGGDPGRQIPRAAFGGVLSVMALYLLVNAAVLAVIPIPAIARDALPAATAAGVVFGTAGARVVNAIVAVALPSAIIANLLMASRVAYALGRDGVASAWLARTNAGGAPSAALLAGTAVTLAFLLTGTFERVVALCSFLFVASYAVSFSALFVLRRREPDAPRPWRARGHPWTTGFLVAGSLAFLAGVIAVDLRGGLTALALVALAYPLYRLLGGGAAHRAADA